jgi:gamma-glutamyl:cysteine ligase YbdK (ATP-grasp superfamily)
MGEGGTRSVDRLRDSGGVDYDAFEDRVHEEAKWLKETLAAGNFDNDGTTLGLEYEFYAADRTTGRLRRLPRSLLAAPGFEKELGLHNAELTTGVHPCNSHGFDAVRTEVAAKLTAFQQRAAGSGLRLVSDGMWTLGPAENTTRGYLTEATHEEGLTLAVNVSNAVRYHGFASNRRSIGGHIDVPGVTVDADSPGPVSLTSSIQPHYQCRSAAALPRHLRHAIRLAGPLVALAANAPFLPPDLYDAPEPDREVLFHDGWVENRIPVYEDMMNPADGPAKVCFPEDVETVEEAVDALVDDRPLVPADIEPGGRFDDAFVHLRHKHGSFWRWVRPVFEGPTEAAANVRIEFRPLPGQPTIPDTVALVAVVAGALTGMAAADHPVADLSWKQARENFYAAARDGLDADLRWITADGDETRDVDRLFADLFDVAAEGLQQEGIPADRARRLLAPLRARVDQRRTPAGWKRDAVRAELDAGLPPSQAIRAMQRRYVDRQQRTLHDGHLTDWPAPDA